MFNTIKRSYRESVVMAVGTIVNSLLGLGFYVLAARFLSVSGFGHFSFLLGLGLLAAEIGDLGMSSSLIRFNLKEKFSGAFTLTVLERVAVTAVIITTFTIAARILDPTIIYAGAIAGGLLFASLSLQSLIAAQKYYRQISANLTGNFVRLLLIVFLVNQGLLTPVSTAVIFSLGTAVTFIFIADFWKYFSVPSARIVWAEVLNYSRNLAVSFSLASIGAKVDVPILYYLAGPVASGLYFSAARLVSVTTQVAAAIEAVYGPKFSADPADTRHFRDYLWLVIFLAVGAIAVIPVAPFLVPIIFGVKYIPSVGILQVLLVSSAVFFLAGPFSASILYRFGKSSYHFFGSLVNLVVTFVSYLILIPVFGAVGAALASLLGNGVLLGVLVFFERKLRHV